MILMVYFSVNKLYRYSTLISLFNDADFLKIADVESDIVLLRSLLDMKFNQTLNTSYKESNSFKSNKDLKRTISDSTSAIFKKSASLNNEINVEYLYNLLTEK
jgi:hypothetical protein